MYVPKAAEPKTPAYIGRLDKDILHEESCTYNNDHWSLNLEDLKYMRCEQASQSVSYKCKTGVQTTHPKFKNV